MRQAWLLVASFLVTITILGGLFFVLESGSPQSTPAPTATATPARVVTSEACPPPKNTRDRMVAK